EQPDAPQLRSGQPEGAAEQRRLVMNLVLVQGIPGALLRRNTGELLIEHPIARPHELPYRFRNADHGSWLGAWGGGRPWRAARGRRSPIAGRPPPGRAMQRPRRSLQAVGMRRKSLSRTSP